MDIFEEKSSWQDMKRSWQERAHRLGAMLNVWRASIHRVEGKHGAFNHSAMGGQALLTSHLACTPLLHAPSSQ